MKDNWQMYAYTAAVDLSATHLAKKDEVIIGHLRDTIDNIIKAIELIEGNDA